MRIGTITSYGIFDSKNRLIENKTHQRKINNFELEYIVSANSTTTTLNGKQYKLSANSFLLAKPNQIRETIADFKCYYIHLKLSKDSEFFDVLNNLPDYTLLLNKEKCKTTMKELISHLLMNGYTPECEYINAKLLELFYHLKSNLTQNNAYTQSSLKNNSDFLPQIINYIDSNYANKITLQSLSDIVGYSPNYFHTVFSSIMGITPQNYITKIRVSKAKYKLSASTKSLADIAYECGFSSQSHFTATFKQETNMTPYEFRKLCNTNYFT